MNAYHHMQALVAIVVVLNILDALTTWYGISHGIAREGDTPMKRALAWVGTTWGGLLALKVPALSLAALAALPQLFASWVPTQVLVFAADVPDWSWYLQIALYTVVVVNNVRIVYAHALERMEAEWSRW